MLTPTEEMLVRELRAARRAISAMKRETNKYEYGREVAIKATKRINTVLAAVKAAHR